MSSKRKKELYQRKQKILEILKPLLEELKNIDTEIQYLEAHQVNNYENKPIHYRKGRK